MSSIIKEDKTFRNLSRQGKVTEPTEFVNCTFIDCDFSNSSFSSSKFIDCTFTNCNMSLTKLSNCQLNNALFKECKLVGINFHECLDFLFSADFEDCILDYCSFFQKKMIKTNFKNCSMKNCDFTEADLMKSSFINSDLADTVFFKTNLREVNFLTAFNYGIDPEINQLKKAKFSIVGVPGLLNKYGIEIQ